MYAERIATIGRQKSISLLPTAEKKRKTTKSRTVRMASTPAIMYTASGNALRNKNPTPHTTSSFLWSRCGHKVRSTGSRICAKMVDYRSESNLVSQDTASPQQMFTKKYLEVAIVDRIPPDRAKQAGIDGMESQDRHAH
ncbi:hypothetical protein EDD15DRAFT_2199853 [Pisolithus albus]|nr:hypothetical protein EDD15DRAFT_2199853 [Pisolithus albus]